MTILKLVNYVVGVLFIKTVTSSVNCFGKGIKYIFFFLFSNSNRSSVVLIGQLGKQPSFVSRCKNGERIIFLCQSHKNGERKIVTNIVKCMDETERTLQTVVSQH